MKLGNVAARAALAASITLSLLFAPLAAAQAPKQLRFGLLPA